ncbi:MAG: methylated-DNA--[protein]-cysteine S-methyltransferase [Paludibacteraceae bacterium]|nr:methylated-DNA--[protein]-cysteine S-methyltransferase [Paludibacteraceae bacterium]
MHTHYHSPIGLLQLQGTESHISHVQFVDAATAVDNTNWKLGQEAKKQLEEYFAGKRKDFDLPLQPVGTNFQQAVWMALRQIPFGHTVSYGDIAQAIGNPKAARAIGQANNRNPIAIIVPCHRVIGRNGKLTGYAGGLDKKEFLLKLEIPQQSL